MNIVSNINKYENINQIIKFINPLQEQIVFDNSRIILINGCAGSRKTDTIIKKGVYELYVNCKNILFLTFVSSVSNEIRTRIEQTLNILIPKIGSSNHYLAEYNGNFIEIANIDAWIHKQLNCIQNNLLIKTDIIPNNKELSVNYNNKVIELLEYTKKYMFYNIVLKNNNFADVIIIDEFQDTDLIKVNLLTEILKNNNNLKCTVAGDILQTIFINNIGCKNFENSMNYFKNHLNPKYYEINTCFRCPSSHIEFVNYLLEEHYVSNGLNLMISHNNDNINKPVLFGHDCISQNESAYKLALAISNTIITILKYDSDIKPSDIAIIMKKSNSNFVFEHIKNILPSLFKKFYFQSNHHSDNEHYLIHFETNGDGFSNTICWEKSKNKTVLLSIHGDKGKGHKVVFFLGLSKKSIPNDFNVGKKFELFDISLLNVALTRSLKYLFIGFTLNSPSIYLSLKHNNLHKYCYLSWDKTTYSSLIHENFIYDKIIKELNKYWFDKLSYNQKIPKFTIEHNIPLIPIKIKLRVSEDISKDLSLYLEKIIPSFTIDTDCIDLYDTLYLDIPESFYNIIGYIGELLLRRFHMICTNNFVFFNWIKKTQIYYTDSDFLINCVFDYKLNNFINDSSLWKEMLLNIELDSINNNTDKKHIDLIKNLQNFNEPVLIINSYYFNFNLKNIIDLFCSNISNEQFIIDSKNIIIIALLYTELISEVRRDFIYELTNKVIKSNNIDKLIQQINLNCTYVWKTYLNDNDIEFQKNISIEKTLIDKKILHSYGFKYNSDRYIFKKGLKLSIGGICDIFNNSSNTLFEIKTCIKTSFSNEWILQIITYNLLLKLTNNIDIKNNYIINLFDGSIYKIVFYQNIDILKKILKYYEFDDFLLNFLLY